MSWSVSDTRVYLDPSLESRRRMTDPLQPFIGAGVPSDTSSGTHSPCHVP